MNSIAQAQNIVQDFTLWEATDEASSLFAMISPDTTSDAHLRVSEEHKYIFPEFDGCTGKTLLESILSTILPYSLFYTWERTMSFGGIKPWPSTFAIAKRAGRSVRTIQDNIQHLEERGLLEIEPTLKQVKNDEGSELRGVFCKDFSGLYHLAHEYYEWTRTPLSQINRSEHKDCKRLTEKHLIYEAMSQDPQLAAHIRSREDFYRQVLIAEQIYQKVCKFANYQRYLHKFDNMTIDDIDYLKSFLLNEAEEGKPAQSLAADFAPYETNQKEINNSKYMCDSKRDSNKIYTGNKFYSDLNRDSLYISDNTYNEDSNKDLQYSPIDTILTYKSKDKNITLNKQLCSIISRKITANEEIAGENKQLSTSSIVSSPKDQNVEVCITDNTDNTPLQPIARKIRKEGKDAKRELFNTNQKILENTTKRAKDQNAKNYVFPESLQERNDRLKRNEEIKNIIECLSPELNDQSKISTLTRVCRIFERSSLSYEEFKEIMYYARKQVTALGDEQIRCRGANGKANRIPLWLHITEEVAGTGLACVLAHDEMARRTREAAEAEYQKRLEQEREESLQHFLESMSKHPQENNEVQEEVPNACPFAEPEEAHQLNEQDKCSPADGLSIDEQIHQRADEIYMNKLREVLLQIRCDKGLNIFYGKEKCKCGESLRTRTKKGAPCCITCDPPADWDPQMPAQLMKILTKQLLSAEQCTELARAEISPASPESPCDTIADTSEEPANEPPSSDQKIITLAEVQKRAEQILQLRIEGACASIQQTTNEVIKIIPDGCSACRCRVGSLIPGSGDGQLRCIACSPPERWKPQLRKRAKNALANIPTSKWCYERAKFELTRDGGVLATAEEIASSC